MQCSISGEICSEPVISPKTGRIFEKRLILQHLKTKNYDPTNEDIELKPEDLIDISPQAPPKQPRGASSIPGLLKTFQNEWDSLVLENLELRTQLNGVRQELAHALYQHEAACRVISRLIKERDEARNLMGKSSLSTTSKETSNKNIIKDNKEEMEVETLIPNEIISKLVETQKNISSSKKEKLKTLKENAPKSEEISKFQEKNKFNVHKTTSPGVHCIDLKDKFMVTGGEDTKTIIFNFDTKKVVNTLGDHSKKVTDVLFHPTEKLLFSTSSDGTGILRKQSGKTWKKIQTVSHAKEVVGCVLCPQGDFWVTGSLDKSWKFNDIQALTSIAIVDANLPIHSISIHPDGLLLGTGLSKDSALIWDLRTQKNVESFSGHKGKINSLSFSENGLFVATCSEKTVSLFDLRDSKKPLQSISLSADAYSVKFDPSGQFLAVGSDQLKIFSGKEMKEIFSENNHTKSVTDVCWSQNSSSLVSTSLDRFIRVWGN